MQHAIEIPDVLTFEQLMTTHPDYDGTLYRELALFYEGGAALIKAAKNPTAFGLPKDHEILLRRFKEDEGLYKDRLRRMYTLGYFGPIVDMFRACIFSDEPAIEIDNDDGEQEFFTQFSDDIDGRGTNLAEWMGRSFVEAATSGAVLALVDFPSISVVDGEKKRPQDRNEEEAMGLRDPRLVLIHRQQLLDFGRDDAGNLVWGNVHSMKVPRGNLSKKREIVVHTWRICVPGEIHVFTFEHKKTEGFEALLNKRVEKQATHKLRFPDLPLVEMLLPAGMWIGQKLHPAEWELLQKQNALSWAEWVTAYAFIAAYVADQEILTKRSDHGIWKIFAPEDRVEWVENSGAALGHLTKTLERIKQEEFRVVSQLPLAAPLGLAKESGEAKRRDRDPMDRVCVAYGDALWEFIVKAFHLIANGRASSPTNEDINFKTSGMRTFNDAELERLLRMVKDGTAEKLGSDAALAAIRKEIVRKLLDAAPEELEEMFTEIEAAAEQAGTAEKVRPVMDDIRNRLELARATQGGNGELPDAGRRGGRRRS